MRNATRVGTLLTRTALVAQAIEEHFPECPAVVDQHRDEVAALGAGVNGRMSQAEHGTDDEEEEVPPDDLPLLELSVDLLAHQVAQHKAACSAPE